MSVLSDLLQDIADAIRVKTGGTDKLAPANFPEEIMSIVIGSGGTDSGGGSGDALTFKRGILSGSGRVTVTHGLGRIPDLVIVTPRYSSSEDTDGALLDKKVGSAYGFRSGIQGVSVYNHFDFCMAYYNADTKTSTVSVLSMGSSSGIDVLPASEQNTGFISADENTLSFGGTGEAKLLAGGYDWLAITGLGGTAANTDVKYVTFKSHDGAVTLGKKAVATGDDCADPIERGIFSAPTRESDAQYDYTFSGWATEQGGGVDSSALKAVSADRTVYAAYTGAVRYYTITYYDSDGSTVLNAESLAYGAVPSYEAEKEGFGFGGWTPELAPVTGNASYTVSWQEKLTFANASWAQIAEISEAGQAKEYFQVGDTKEITYNGQPMTLMIAGFDHDDLADGSGKAGISIVFNNLSTNKSNYTSGNGYDSISSYMNGGGTYSVMGYLPEALQSVIKPVVKRYVPKSKASTGTLTESDTTTISQKLWALSMKEMGIDYPNTTNTSPSLGKTYEVFNGAAGLAYPDGYKNNGQTLKLLVPVAGKTSISSSEYYWIRDANRVGLHQPMYVCTGSYSTSFSVSFSNSNKAGHFRCGFCI